MFRNPFENTFKEDELSRLLSTVVKIKGKSTTKEYSYDTFYSFLNMKNLPEYERVFYNLSQMKGWKHSEEEYKGKTKGEWFNYIKIEKTPVCFLSGDDNTLVKNPYMILDIDGVECNEEVLATINSFPYIMMTGISCSGDGYFSVARIDESVKTREDFVGCFEYISEEFEEKGIKLDTQCKNINRGRVLTPYDILINDNFSEVCFYKPQPSKNKKVREKFSAEYKVVSLKTTIPDFLKIYGKAGEDYYCNSRKNKGLLLEYPLTEEGRNYHILYSYANALYRALGEEGWDIYCEYFPETSDSILSGYWNSARGWKGDVKGKIIFELKQLGIVE